MPSSGMLRRMVLVRTDVSEESIASIITVKKPANETGTLATTSNWITLGRNTDSFHPDGDDTLLRNIGSYKSHAV
jgi:hypothetical protein